MNHYAYVLFDNMWTQKFKAQPAKKNAFCATVNQIFSSSSQVLTTAECAVIKLLSSSNNETELGTSRKLGGATKDFIGGSEKQICRLNFEF